jgi:hypothetical protein
MTPADQFARSIKLLEETREALRKSVELRRQCAATREASQKQTARILGKL